MKPPPRYRDPIQFYKPNFIDPPKVLLGDAGDGRCPDTTQPCFKNNDDLLNGQTHILRQADLVLGYKTGESLLLTDNSTITASTAKARPMTAPATPGLLSPVRGFSICPPTRQ